MKEDKAAAAEEQRWKESLSKLDDFMVKMKSLKGSMVSHLDTFDDSTCKIESEAKYLQQCMGSLKSQLDNIEATRRKVDKVAGRMLDIERVQIQLDQSSDSVETSGLLSWVDNLREATEYAQAVVGDTADGGIPRFREQEVLLDNASRLLDNRYRRVLATLAPIDPHRVNLKDLQATSCMLSLIPQEGADQLRELARRMDGVEHISDLCDALGKAVRTTLETTFSIPEYIKDERGEVTFYTPGTHYVITVIYLFHRLMAAAKQLATYVLGESRWRAYISAIDGIEFRKKFGVDTVIRRVRICAQGKRRSNDQIFVNLDMLKHFSALDWRVLPQSFAAGESPYQVWLDCRGFVVQETVVLANRFVTEVTNSETPTPVDGCVFEVTAGAVQLLKGVLLYFGEQQFDSTWMDAGEDLHPDDPPFRSYFRRLIKATLATIHCRSKLLAEKKQKAVLSRIFVINNIHHIYWHLEELQLGWVVSTHCTLLWDRLQKETAEYRAGWRTIGKHLDEPIPGLTADTRTLSDKAKEGIKKRLKHFNEALTSRIAEESEINVPHAKLRETLVNHAIEEVVPRYDAFYRRFLHLPFSRNPEKHIRFTPGIERGSLFQRLQSELFVPSTAVKKK